MSQFKSYQSSVAHTNGLTGRPRSRRWAVRLWVGVLVVVAAAVSLTAAGASAISRVCWFLEFYSGVFSLVALSITVMIGLAATDRIVLAIRHRVLLQTAHRAVATSAMACLGVHLVMKVEEGHAHVIDAVVPFLASHRVLYVGFGTLASYLMILAMWTGLARGRFANSTHPGAWRILHATAYASWLLALAHGLMSGRPAKTWVTVSYAACLILVGFALLVRLSVSSNRRGLFVKARTFKTYRGGRPPHAVEHSTDDRDVVRAVHTVPTFGAPPPQAEDDGPIPATPIPEPARDGERPVTAPAHDRSPTLAHPSPLATTAAERPLAGGHGQPWEQDKVPGQLSRADGTLVDISDEEFWAYMRGEALR